VPRAFLLDCFDSFTHNVACGLVAAGAEVQVARADRCSVADVAASAPDLLVLSPGPGRPEDARLAQELVAAFAGRVPLLGICLGMQVLATAFGGRVDRSPQPVHGKVSRVDHDGSGLFADLPQGLEVGRYHSLCVVEVPPVLRANAWTPEGLVMGLRHRELALAGVQFHPDSFLTPMGLSFFRHALQGRL